MVYAKQDIKLNKFLIKKTTLTVQIEKYKVLLWFETEFAPTLASQVRSTVVGLTNQSQRKRKPMQVAGNSCWRSVIDKLMKRLW